LRRSVFGDEAPDGPSRLATVEPAERRSLFVRWSSHVDSIPVAPRAGDLTLDGRDPERAPEQPEGARAVEAQVGSHSSAATFDVFELLGDPRAATIQRGYHLLVRSARWDDDLERVLSA
jgi:hypothetical protein